ncbi:hypothetical protein BDK51DRAFT_52422 [Blyttiomyces helicus]|uniref:Arf-GAP domain-containing protein n=1 Tax=Blyttiomyces helicus TaxID=388810 RepID=A0A4P9WEV3_9FUNG|nr:hypothetical protein BDK51DRAFT_52422 [Blyttiomyces helicus]|eukprot:RKO90335.1 hypothetical protein BDK51DRAFT_52422 [Blyttiomyces helicus]
MGIGVDRANIDQWIRAKYERKQYAKKGPIPDPDTLPLPDGVAPPQTYAPAPTPQAKPATPQPAFANFAAAPAPATTAPKSSASDDLFSVFQSPPSTTPTAALQPQQGQQAGLKSSILSLYATPAQQQAPTNFAAFGAAAGFSSAPTPGFGAPIPVAGPSGGFGGFSTPPPVQQQPLQPQGAQFFGLASTTTSSPTAPAFGAFSAPLSPSSIGTPVHQQQQPASGAVGGIPNFAGFGAAAAVPAPVQKPPSAEDVWGSFQ